MEVKKLALAAKAAVLSVSVFAAAQEESEKTSQFEWEMGNGISYGETSIMSTEFGLAFDSKYMTYGLVDNRDPIMTPSASATFFDFLTFEIEAIYDLTTQGRKAGRTNRGGKYMELDPGAYLSWSFSPEDNEALPTTIDVSFGYFYEYHPRSMHGKECDWANTHYLWAEIGLPDLWLEPLLYIERDLKRDNGTYASLELGHTFSLIDSDDEEDDPVLALRPSVAQGVGNTQRVRGYLWLYDAATDEDRPLDHGGLMDTCVKCELTWTVCDWLSLSGYVAYYDYIFDGNMRDAAREYTGRASDDNSYHFVTGLSLTASF